MTDSVDHPLVDVIIAVHNPARPIARAVASVLRHTSSDVRVTVVCHNTDRAGIAANLREFADDPRLRLLEHRDDIASPSGPFNAGLDAATGSFSAIMGSDDELAPGAVDSWVRVQKRDAASMVIPRLAHATGEGVATPPVRPFRTRRLDPVRDRLAYRSAPLGLVSRSRLGDVRLATGSGTGEDNAYSLRVWFSGEPISFDIAGPVYLIHDDARDRVTFAVRSIARELHFLEALLDATFISALSGRGRAAVVVKLIRIHIFGAVYNRRDAPEWDAADLSDLEAMARRIIAIAPDAVRVLSRADRDLLDEVMLGAEGSASRLAQLARDRRRFLRPAAVLPRSVRHTFAREAPLRMLASSWLVRRAAGESHVPGTSHSRPSARTGRSSPSL